MALQARAARSPDHAGEPSFRSGFSWLWMVIVLCAATGLALSVALFLVMSQRETRLAEARFHLDAERQTERIHRAVDDVTTSVQVLRAFFAGSELVEPDEFRVFTDPLARATPNALLFGWAAAAAGDDGKESFPALYLSDNDHLPVETGWDLASVPECREALDRARKSGDLASSAPFSFDEAAPAVVLLAAVEENEGIEGFVFAFFAPADVLRSALLIPLADVIHLRVMDQQEAGKPVLLAEHDGVDVQPDRRFRIGALELMPFERRWEVGGRTWLVECRLTAGLIATRCSWLPWASGTVAVLLTVAGVSILVMLALQTSRVERLVAARTAEVRQSEARLRTITDTALDAVIMMAPDGTVAHWNPAAEKMFGYRRSEIVGRDVHETLVPEEYRERALQGLRRFARTGEGDAVGRVLELEAVHKDGTQFPVEISVAAIRMAGRWGAVAIVRDITRRRTAEEAVRREQALLRQLLDFQERERKLMAYEIHDGLVQQLTGAHLTLQSLPQAPGGDDTSARDRFETASGLLRDAIAEARRIISGLRPPILDESGIQPAVAHLIDQQRRRGGPQVELVSKLADQRFSPLVETAAFRIVQEAVNNACRYSRSELVRVELRTDGNELHIEVRDWGQGFNPERVGADHFGLQGIRERARLLEGHAEIQSASGEGTTIRVSLPTRPSSNGNGTLRATREESI